MHVADAANVWDETGMSGPSGGSRPLRQAGMAGEEGASSTAQDQDHTATPGTSFVVAFRFAESVSPMT
jgi:hypothetical protein